jgi:hypothetical protein
VDAQYTLPHAAAARAVAGSPAAFAIERQQGVLVEQVVDIGQDRQAAVEIHSGIEVDDLVARQLQVERCRCICRHPRKWKVVDKGPRVVFLIARLSVPVANVLEGGSEMPVRAAAQLEIVSRVGRELEFRHRGQAIAIANATQHGAGAIDHRRVELRRENAA